MTDRAMKHHCEEDIMAQLLSRILVPIIFFTKNPFPFLNDHEFRKRMHPFLACVFCEHESPVIGVGGTEDPVPIACFLSRNLAISEIIRKARANSTTWNMMKDIYGPKEAAPPLQGF